MPMFLEDVENGGAVGEGVDPGLFGTWLEFVSLNLGTGGKQRVEALRYD